jgi:predicted amino acid-binding ACT domain protein
MSRFAVSVFGRDRPGIVAAVTRVLADAGCNLEDTSMTILRGHFAMMLVVTGPAQPGAADLEADLAPVADRLQLQVSVRAVTDEVTAADGGGARYAAAVYGADRPGLPRRAPPGWSRPSPSRPGPCCMSSTIWTGCCSSTGWCRRPPTCSGGGATGDRRP